MVVNRFDIPSVVITVTPAISSVGPATEGERAEEGRLAKSRVRGGKTCCYAGGIGMDGKLETEREYDEFHVLSEGTGLKSASKCDAALTSTHFSGLVSNLIGHFCEISGY
ncbi:unnamed protein product [Hydatigera taeniaeformis]|uniref:Uncharacterized protein n=1 Tax=Hydatigena taeniaeformis TaxID=6205 RepID=A0A0R3WQG8_HYDTA|nr:unnamed protein product [Hydatigera taeniaeformis]